VTDPGQPAGLRQQPIHILPAQQRDHEIVQRLGAVTLGHVAEDGVTDAVSAGARPGQQLPRGPLFPLQGGGIGRGQVARDEKQAAEKVIPCGRQPRAQAHQRLAGLRGGGHVPLDAGPGDDREMAACMNEQRICSLKGVSGRQARVTALGYRRKNRDDPA